MIIEQDALPAQAPPAPPSPPTPPQPPTPPAAPAPAPVADAPFVFIPEGNGNVKSIRFDGKRLIVEKTDGTTKSLLVRDVVPREAVTIAQSFGLMLLLMVVGLPISRAVARWIDRRSAVPRAPRELSDRLTHMESALEQVAVDVERISEAQRYSTQLLAAREHERVS